jgi:hypothetical protein
MRFRVKEDWAGAFGEIEPPHFSLNTNLSGKMFREEISDERHRS